MGVPNGENTADIVGSASKVIEENLSEGTMPCLCRLWRLNPISTRMSFSPTTLHKQGHRALAQILLDDFG